MLEMSGIVRSFGGRTALDGVDLVVRPGRVTGFVGANGAGKTTAMRIAMGVLAADAGEVRWRGRPITTDDRFRFGYMPEERGLYPRMPVLEQVVYLARLLGLDAEAARASATGLLEEFGLAERSGDLLETLSLGNQQRVQLAAALVHDPELLLLDEPFSGLDPVAVEAMAGRLRRRAAEGVPVLFSSHQLDLVERLCDDLVVLNAGRVVAAGDAGELRRRYATGRVRVRLDGDAGWLRERPGLAVVDVDGPVAVVEPEGDPQLVLHELLRHGPVHEFTPVVPPLSEVFAEVSR